MDKKVAFRWVSLVRDVEDHANGFFNDEAAIRGVSTRVSVKQMAEAVKAVKDLGRVSLPLKGRGCTVVIQGLTTPVQLLSHIDVRDTTTTLCVVDKGPSLQWLLDHEEEINDYSSDNALYTNSMAIRSMPYSTINKNTVVITTLDVSDISNVIDGLQDRYIVWLDGTFNTFLAKYGYTDADTVRRASQALMVYQAAEKLGFKDPATVAANLGDKCLGADLILRGVFADVGNA